MKKILLCLIIMAFMFAIVGCNNGGTTHASDPTGNTQPSTKPAVQMDIDALKTDIIQQLQVKDSMELPKDRLTDMYGFAQEDIKSSACYITMGGAFVEEIILLECTDDAAAERLVQKLEVKLSDAKSQAQNYDAQTYTMLGDCKVQRMDTYVALFISGDAPQMQQMFDAAAK